MEHKIGEIITLPDGRKAEVVEAPESWCAECVFWSTNWCWTRKTECNSKTRTDHKNIIYKEIKEG